VLSATSRPSEGFLRFERTRVSPKRDVVVMCGALLIF